MHGLQPSSSSTPFEIHLLDSRPLEEASVLTEIPVTVVLAVANMNGVKLNHYVAEGFTAVVGIDERSCKKPIQSALPGFQLIQLSSSCASLPHVSESKHR
jgi:hypothetical protein